MPLPDRICLKGQKRNQLRQIEVIVLIIVIALIMGVSFPARINLNLPRSRVVCGTNLKGLGNAMTVYAPRK